MHSDRTPEVGASLSRPALHQAAHLLTKSAFHKVRACQIVSHREVADLVELIRGQLDRELADFAAIFQMIGIGAGTRITNTPTILAGSAIGMAELG
jgi:hypothetical protein